MGIDGESSRLSLTTAGSFTNAALGSESATGVGTPEFELATRCYLAQTALVATHPAGSAGGVTPSKFSLKLGTKARQRSRRRWHSATAAGATVTDRERGHVVEGRATGIRGGGADHVRSRRRAASQRGRAVNQALVGRAAADRPAGIGVGGIDRPVNSGRGRKIICEGQAGRRERTIIGQSDRESDLGAASHEGSIGGFGDADIG